MEGGWRLSINISTNGSQLSSSLPRCSIWALTEGISPSRKNRMRSDSSGAPSASSSMEMLEVRRPILNFLLLVLRVLLNPLESPGLFRRKALNWTRLDCLVLPTLVLVPTKANPITKERSCKQRTVGASGAGGIEMILALLGGLLGGLPVDCFAPGGTKPCRAS